MTDFLFIDLESRSTVDLRKAGAHKYWEGHTEVIVACWALGDGPVQTWWPGQPCPPPIVQHVHAGGMISGWNVGFEKLGWQHDLGPRHGWPVPRLEQYDDTAAAAASMSLPRALGDAAKALGIAEQKDDEGRRIMLQMSKPRRPRKGEDPDGIYWWDDRERMERLAAYCVRDVEAERAIRRLLVPLSPAERDVWLLDQRMNDRGVLIDLPLVGAMLRITDDAKAALDKEMARATDWNVTACSQVTALTAWLKEQGVTAAALNKNAIEDMLTGELPDKARRAVELRKEYAKTSTAKLKAMQEVACQDSRARGLHLYHGAGTGRWAGRLIQPQNMPRGTGTVKDVDSARGDFLTGHAGWIDFVHGSPMSAVSDMLRSCLIASPGHRLIAADYSSIEGRVTAWLADDRDEIRAYRAVDAGTGAGIYEIAASGIFNVPAEKVTKAQRQVGKAATLALGFGGGVLAFKAMADIYGIDMAPVHDILQPITDAEVWSRACDRYDECKERGDTGTDVMTREAWIASEVTKVLWRARHPATVALWAGLEGAARAAVEAPGTKQTYGRITYLVSRGFLWCRLPSGRCLAYGAPRIEQRDTPWGDKKPSVTALGVDSVTKRWTRFALYGGLATENAVQAVARDLMATGMLNAEKAGYPIVLTVHDEAVADTPEGFGSVAEFERLLCDLPAWADGLPVSAEGYDAKSYRK